MVTMEPVRKRGQFLRGLDLDGMERSVLEPDGIEELIEVLDRPFRESGFNRPIVGQGEEFPFLDQVGNLHIPVHHRLHHIGGMTFLFGGRRDHGPVAGGHLLGGRFIELRRSSQWG